LLLPQDMREWLPEGDLAYFIPDVVATLDLSAIYSTYDGSRGGQPPFHPEMMVSLLLYAYCKGCPVRARSKRPRIRWSGFGWCRRISIRTTTRFRSFASGT